MARSPFEGQVWYMLTITKEEFQQLAAYIKANYGIYLKLWNLLKRRETDSGYG